MIPHGVEVFVGLDPIDLRWGFNRLTGLVAERIGRDARGGALFVFFGKRREAMSASAGGTAAVVSASSPRLADSRTPSLKEPALLKAHRAASRQSTT